MRIKKGIIIMDANNARKEEHMSCMLVTADGAVNFRSAPSIKAPSMGVFMGGSEVYADSKTLDLPFTRVVNQNGVIGYVMSKFLTRKEG